MGKVNRVHNFWSALGAGIILGLGAMLVFLAGVLVAGLGVAAVLFLIALRFLLLAAAGAGVGWLVGLVFGPAILAVLASVGIKGVALWQIGAAFGFIAGFFVKNPRKIVVKNPL